MVLQISGESIGFARFRSLAVIGLFAALLLAATPECTAYPENYPPFRDAEPTRYPSLNAEPVLDYHASSPYEEGIIRISTSAEQEGVGRVTEVQVSGQRIFDTASVHPDLFLQSGSRVFYADVTGDGRKDILIYSYPGSVGIGSQIEIADLLIAQSDGGFIRTTFEAFAAGPEDFIDVNDDGRYEMLWVSYYQTDVPHSYWVYRLAEITDSGLRLNDGLAPGFPKVIWFTEKPNDRVADNLTAEERAALIQQSDEKWFSDYAESGTTPHGADS